MTVGELKSWLSNDPDDWEVVVWVEGDGLCTTDWTYDPTRGIVIFNAEDPHTCEEI